MLLTSIDDAAWTSPWRGRAVVDKAVLSIGLAATAACVRPYPAGLLIALVAVGCLLGPARIPGRLLAAALVAPAGFLLIGAASVAVSVGAPGTRPGTIWASWGPFAVGPDSAWQALDLLGHGLVGTLAVFVLAMTTPLVDLVTASRRLHIPDACLDVASLTYRLLFLLLDTARTIADAQRARLGGVGANTGARGRARVRAEFGVAAALAATTFARAWRRAHHLARGLDARGYNSSLVTLPTDHHRSIRFEIGAVVAILTIWAFAGVTGTLR